MKRLERKWMYEERYDKKRRVTNSFIKGVGEFIEFAKQQDEYRLGEKKLRCPCSKCKNMKYLHDFEVEEHLYTSGFLPNYYNWISHGESYSLIPEQTQTHQNENTYRDIIADVWHPTTEHLVRERYHEVCQRHYKDNTYKIAVRKNKVPKYMEGGAYEGLMKHRETREFKNKSKQAKINKMGGVEGADVDSIHYGGSQSSYDRTLQNAKSNKGKLQSAVKIVFDTHTKVRSTDGERLFFLKKKAKAIYDTYMHEVENNQSGKSENEIWSATLEGYKKRDVCGVGNAHDLLYGAPHRRSGAYKKQSYVTEIITQLQDQLEAQQRREAERDEELRKLREDMERMRSLFNNCNPSFRPPYPDPRDPYGGGSSGASFGFHA